MDPKFPEYNNPQNNIEQNPIFLPPEEVFIEVERKIVSRLASFFTDPVIEKYPGSERVYVKITPSLKEWNEVMHMLDLLNVSYWEDEETSSFTIDNHFDIETLVEKGVIDISGLSDEKYKKLALLSQSLYDVYGPRFKIELQQGVPMKTMRPIPSLFKKEGRKVSHFDDMSEGETLPSPHHGNIGYLYQVSRRKYERELGKLYKKQKQGRVEISEDEQRDLLESAQSGSESARNECLLMNMGLVYFTAFNMARLFPGINQDDMLQEGLMAMDRCITKIKKDKNIKFSTYAVVSMEYAMINFAQEFLRDIFIPSHVQTEIFKISKMDRASISRSGKKVGVKEIAYELSISEDKARDLLNLKKEIYDAVFLDIEDLDENSDPGDDERVVREIQAKYEAAIVADWLDRLPPRQSEIIRGRFGIDTEEMTLEELGDKFGISKDRIRQIEATTIRTLRTLAQISIKPSDVFLDPVDYAPYNPLQKHNKNSNEYGAASQANINETLPVHVEGMNLKELQKMKDESLEIIRTQQGYKDALLKRMEKIAKTDFDRKWKAERHLRDIVEVIDTQAQTVIKISNMQLFILPESDHVCESIKKDIRQMQDLRKEL